MTVPECGRCNGRGVCISKEGDEHRCLACNGFGLAHGVRTSTSTSRGIEYELLRSAQQRLNGLQEEEEETLRRLLLDAAAAIRDLSRQYVRVHGERRVYDIGGGHNAEYFEFEHGQPVMVVQTETDVSRDEHLLSRFADLAEQIDGVIVFGYRVSFFRPEPKTTANTNVPTLFERLVGDITS